MGDRASPRPLGWLLAVRVAWLCAGAVTIGVLVSGIVLASATPAAAHAALVSSQPEAGAELATTPGVVTVSFSEPLIVELSTVQATDPLGDVWERSAVDERSMSVQLDTTAPGVYVVAWKTVSPIDGHTLRGSFEFGVGVGVEHPHGVAGTEPSRGDVVVAVARTVEYAALLLAVGTLIVGRIRTPRPPAAVLARRLRRPLLVALAAGIAVVVGEAVLASDTPAVNAITQYLSAPPGTPRMLRVAAEGVAVGATLLPLRWFAAGAALAALAGLAAAGHAAATHPWWWGVSVATVHLAAAGVWAGGIAAMALSPPDGGWRGDEGRALLRAFSPVAVAAFALTVASGTLRAFQELVSWRDLLTTTYGQVLAVKILAVALMVPLSWRAWHNRSPRPRAEVSLAIIAVAAAGVLAAFPVPPQRAAEDAGLAEQDVSAGLPAADEVVLADTVGDTVVGLTLRPGRRGSNDAFVYLLPADGPEAASGLDASLSVDGERRRPLERCGPACRRTTIDIRGGDAIEVHVAGDADRATFTVPDFPARSAEQLIDRMTAAMNDLAALRYDEVFGPVDPPIRSTAAMLVPDRFRFTTHTTGREVIRIGETIYRREGEGPWERSDAPAVEVPSYIWEYPDKLAARVIGTETVDGTRTRVVTFFVEVSGSPVWYRLWIGEDGLVRKAEMRTQGHFMDRTYYDFNADIEIEPPARRLP